MIFQCKKVNFSSIRTNGKKDYYISSDRALQALSIRQLISFKNVHFQKKKFDIMSNMPSTRLLFADFDHSISIYCQNAYDIRNQHQKLSLIVYFFAEKKFCQNYTCTPPQLF